ncbi:MAG: transposase family protein [Ktedonobacterales bacterium]|nr:transposase family protein [Ktedonobacterales bacterium]
MSEAEPFPAWATRTSAVEAELVAWRAAHPRATLSEIEAAVQQAVTCLREQYLSDLIHASGATDPTTLPDTAQPVCPTCGGRLAPRGWQERTVLTAGQPTPVHLRRRYLVCAACGSGVFPP